MECLPVATMESALHFLDSAHMNHRFQFGYSWFEWWFLALIVGTLGLAGGGLYLLVMRESAAIWCLLAAGVALFSTLMSALLIHRSRFQVVIAPAGFYVTDFKGTREFADEQIICASLSHRLHFNQGDLKSKTRVFELWVEQGDTTEHLQLSTKLNIHTTDLLLHFIDRVHQFLYERASAGLRDSEPFEGEGWTLNATSLVVRQKRTEQSFELSDLCAVEIFDDHLCVWQSGQDEPVLRIPVSAANTRVLQRLLSERLQPREQEPPSEERLGRILFERKPDRASQICVWLLPVLTLAAGLGLLGVWLIPALGARPGVQVAILIMLGIALLSWLIVLSQAVEFRVCEHGVRRKWLFWMSQLRYSQMNSFTYSAVRQYVKGAYAGTRFSLTFCAPTEGKPKTLSYTKTLRNADLELENLREHVSEIIAQRMYADFAAQQPVTWTDSLRFLPEGVEYRARTLFGRKAPVLIPFSQIAGFDSDNGEFHLWVHDKKKPIAKEEINKPNFFPGYHLLARVLASRPTGTEVQSRP
ncbi:MAG: hypothetical protein JSS02_30850 [Planctomycetes bacterium]|nr:hypothetical protein [Planctomycetota bacterium]